MYIYICINLCARIYLRHRAVLIPHDQYSPKGGHDRVSAATFCMRGVRDGFWCFVVLP